MPETSFLHALTSYWPIFMVIVNQKLLQPYTLFSKNNVYMYVYNVDLSLSKVSPAVDSPPPRAIYSGAPPRTITEISVP